MKKLISIVVASLLIIELVPINITNACDEIEVESKLKKIVDDMVFTIDEEDKEEDEDSLNTEEFDIIEGTDKDEFNNLIEHKDIENEINESTIHDNLIINKTISEVKDSYGEGTGEYEVTLNIGIRGLDIVFAIDNSQSMTMDVSSTYLRSKYKEVANRIANIFTNVIEATAKYKNFPVRVGAVVFNGSKSVNGSMDDSEIVFEFTRDKSKITQELHEYNSFGDRFDNKNNLVDVINYEAGLLRAKEMLKDDALSKYIVFYSDGPPTTGIDKEPQSKLEEENINYYEDFKEEIMNIRNDILQEDIKLFSIGDIRGTFDYEYENIKDKNTAILNLKDIINSISTFKVDSNNNDEFIASNSSSFDGIFKKLQTELYKEMDTLIDNEKYISNIKNLTIVDNLKEQYEFIEGTYKIYNFKNKEITNMNEVISINNNNLKVENLNVDSNGLVIKYMIKAVDKAYAENNAVVSNNTWVQWIEDEEINNKSFNEAVVDINPVTVKKGTLNIETIVENNIAEEAIENEEYISFLTNIDSNNKYTLNNKANNKKTIEFYLYDNISDILKASNVNNTYMKCGNYKISAPSPTNHEISSIEVKYDESESWKKLLEDEYLTINNNNRNIFIRINYSIINKNYWNDKKQLRYILN